MTTSMRGVVGSLCVAPGTWARGVSCDVPGPAPPRAVLRVGWTSGARGLGILLGGVAPNPGDSPGGA